ncbi:hypothetical protein GCM10009765_14100 [Fodinicola feengrottensis]|uniref:Uncharacterized protein n=1 Tax=Fodinicola feengrottensis TaxID=435914 RepID=A0ABP4S4J3_9ACTN
MVHYETGRMPQAPWPQPRPVSVSCHHQQVGIGGSGHHDTLNCAGEVLNPAVESEPFDGGAEHGVSSRRGRCSYDIAGIVTGAVAP